VAEARISEHTPLATSTAAPTVASRRDELSTAVHRPQAPALVPVTAPDPNIPQAPPVPVSATQAPAPGAGPRAPVVGRGEAISVPMPVPESDPSSPRRAPKGPGPGTPAAAHSTSKHAVVRTPQDDTPVHAAVSENPHAPPAPPPPPAPAPVSAPVSVSVSVSVPALALRRPPAKIKADARGGPKNAGAGTGAKGPVRGKSDRETASNSTNPHSARPPPLAPIHGPSFPVTFRAQPQSPRAAAALPRAQAQARTQAQTQTQTQAQARTKVRTRTPTQTETTEDTEDTEAGPETETQAHDGPRTDPEREPKLKVAPFPDPEAKFEFESEPQPETETKTKPEIKHEPEYETNPEPAERKRNKIIPRPPQRGGQDPRELSLAGQLAQKRRALRKPAPAYLPDPTAAGPRQAAPQGLMQIMQQRMRNGSRRLVLQPDGFEEQMAARRSVIESDSDE
jgi:hypothetical protein